MAAPNLLVTDTAVKQLSDGNTAGTVLGQSASDPIGFYGATPNGGGGSNPASTQPAGPAQAAVARGQAAGVITTYVSTQSPSAVSANTTAEKAMTVVSGTGGQMLLTTTDLVFAVNKPTAQAGLGYGNLRVSASNTLQVTFSNWTSGSITPTTSQAYAIVALQGIPSLSVVWSPAAVAANSVVEQQVTVPGLMSGHLVQVSKPTSQAGIDIVGCRVIADNTLGVTFANVTASPVTPTAAETYTVFTSAGLDALNNEIMYGFNVGTVGAIGAGVVVSAGATTLTGLLATDMVTGIFDPTAQASATNAAYPVKGIPTADTLTLYFAGIGTGATPTASEIYGIKTTRLAPVAPLVLYNTVPVAPGSVAANTTAEQTFTVTGLIAGTPVWVNKPTWTNGIGIVGCRVSAANTLAITFANGTAAAITPPTENYIIGNFQVKTPGAGNCVYQSVVPAVTATTRLTNSVRAALTGVNLIAGA